ncbi:hypothetical protein ZOSMA_176G00300 [Zostera marina]|uniref:Uncharacterized protein n=1 Tax=Zostera marina TaxID=29655 RepID=A0A0K9PRZ9_ZOSMR|nr:hypothetical protein ZOSMA_176G00300 [Zostera marina]
MDLRFASKRSQFLVLAIVMIILVSAEGRLMKEEDSVHSTIFSLKSPRKLFSVDEEMTTKFDSLPRILNVESEDDYGGFGYYYPPLISDSHPGEIHH